MTSISAENSGQESSGDSWWWLAINGASCAACFFPVRAADLVVSPIPQELIGFHTREEQVSVQRLLLKAPIAEVNQYMRNLQQRFKAGEVAIVRLPNPEPPTQGSTVWSIKRNK